MADLEARSKANEKEEKGFTNEVQKNKGIKRFLMILIADCTIIIE